MQNQAKPRALITGAAGALGHAIHHALLNEGYHCLCTDRVVPKAQASEWMAADLTKPEDLDALTAWASAAGPLALLVNNAGVQRLEPFEERSDAALRQEIEVNQIAPILLIRRLLPSLQAFSGRAPEGTRGAGRAQVVNIVSLGGIFALPETALYSSSKFGLRGVSLGLALDAARLGVDFSIVNPSATESPMLIAEAIHGGNPHQFMDPPQRPTDVAQAVLRAMRSRAVEVYVRPAESWLVRLGMLMPNGLPRVLPWFEGRARRGMAAYVRDLARRGLIESDGNGGWRAR